MNKEDESTFRKDTPGVNNLIHFNNAGASLSPNPVIQTIIDYLSLEAQIGGYEAANASQSKVMHAYDVIAQLIGANSKEIAFVDSATRAWNTILYSFPLSQDDIILTSVSEFGSNVVSLAQVASRTGATIEVVPNDPDGRISIRELRKRLSDKVKLVAITHIPAQRGVINPIEEIGALLQNHSAFFLVDACQSVGQMDIDVNKINCDALTASGRKWLRGPRGTGFLFMREHWISKFNPYIVDLAIADLVNPNLLLHDTQLDIRQDIKRFEQWERSFALMLGLGKAVDYALNIGINQINEIVNKFANTIRGEIARIDGFSIEDAPNANCGIVTITSSKHEITFLKNQLSASRINTSIVQDYDGPLDFNNRRLKSALRVSPHYYNSQEEIETFIETMRRISWKG